MNQQPTQWGLSQSQQQWEQPLSQKGTHRRSLIVGIAIGVFLIIGGSAFAGFWMFSHRPLPTSWIRINSSGVGLIQWSDAQGNLTGQMQVISSNTNNSTENYNLPFTGTYGSVDHSITLTLHPALLSSYTLTGTVNSSVLTLSGQVLNNGTLSTITFHPGTVDDFNQAVSAFKQHIPSGSSLVSSSTPIGSTTSSKNAPISAPTSIPYPSYGDAKTSVKYYYENKSDFRGMRVMQQIDSITYQSEVGPPDQPQFMACVQYQFANTATPAITSGTARHTFTFQYSSGNWSVIDMGNWDSC